MIRHTPGPAAAEAFSFGITITAIGTVAGVSLLVWAERLTTVGAVAALVFGVPVALLVASCLLSIWLGYDKDAVDVALA